MHQSCQLSLLHQWHPCHTIATALEGEQKKQVRTNRISPPPLPPVSSANEAPLPCTLSKAAGSLARLLFRSSSGSSSLSVLWASKGSASRGSPGFVPPVPDPANSHPHQTAISPDPAKVQTHIRLQFHQILQIHSHIRLQFHQILQIHSHIRLQFHQILQCTPTSDCNFTRSCQSTATSDCKSTPTSDCNFTRSCKSTPTSACNFTRPG